MASDFVLKDAAIKKLLQAFKGRAPRARVGVIGNSDPRKPKPAPEAISFESLMRRKVADDAGKEPAPLPTNAQVLAAHEFGVPSRGLPMRSVLRVPIAEQLSRYLEHAGAFKDETIAQVIASGSLDPYMEKIAITAETVVQDGFDTEGFGHWPAWKNPDYQNNTGMLLVDTTQLRKAITSKVDK